MDTRSTRRGGRPNVRRRLFPEDPTQSTSNDTWLDEQDVSQNESDMHRWAFNFKEGRPLNKTEKKKLGVVSTWDWTDARFLAPAIPFPRQLRSTAVVDCASPDGDRNGSRMSEQPGLTRSGSVLSTGSNSSHYSSQSAPPTRASDVGPSLLLLHKKGRFKNCPPPAPKKTKYQKKRAILREREEKKRACESSSEEVEDHPDRKRSKRLIDKARVGVL